ncbi:amidohydrolase [Pseudonocardia sp. TRM90224]|uniref:amidohydrolase n=1 Tax=Pseudonocardia sp. TRM90224 TaxID=2812678 RepID=UPI001E60C9A0|nr:amidohydrolase family protein [Pseudonocardia sp. TRM90224]
MIVFTGGTIRTMDPAAPQVDAVGISGGTIVATGDLATVQAAVGPGAQLHDLAGRTLLPGFVDPHHHLYLVASDEHMRSFDNSPRDLGELLATIATLVEADRRTGWIRLHGVRPLDLAEGRFPTAAELDVVCPDRPLHLLAVTYHESVLNSAGLAELGWSAATPDPVGGELVRDRRGRPTGVLIEMASFAAEAATRRALDDPQAWVDRAVEHTHELAAHGVTRIGDMAVPPDGVARYAAAAPDLAVTVHRWHVGAAAIGDATVPMMEAPLLEVGHPRTPLGGFKLLVDGGERCDLCMTRGQFLRSASTMPGAVLRHGRKAIALARRSGTPTRRHDGLWHSGIRVLDDDRLAEAVRGSVRAGMAPALHAVGNGALEAVLAAVDGLDTQIRVEHAMVCDARLAGRLAGTGVHVVAQPSFLYDLGDELTMLPVPAPLKLIPLRTLVDAGVRVAASSDYPAGTMSPLVGIQAAVTRQVRSGAVVHADEALGVEEAVAAYTCDAAAALGVEGLAGVLRAGAAADLVELAADPWTVAPDRISTIEVTGTWSAGRRSRG